MPHLLATLLLSISPAVAAVLPTHSPGPGVDPTEPGRFATADSILASLHIPAGPGVLAAFIEEGAIAWSGAVGLANLSHGVPLTRKTRINVGSTAKTLTGYALARLHLDGVLSLDDDVRTYLPELPDLGATVTLRHLLTHTSGYREFLNALALGGWRLEDSDHVDPGEALRVVQRQPSLQNEPGAEWNYNNTGFVLLGMVVERVSGVSYPTWIGREVFEPLGMTASTFRLDPTRVIPGAAYGYLPVGAAGGDGDASGWREGRDVGAALGAGALYTTLDDLTRWMSALTGDDPRWADPFRLMTDPFILNDGTPTTYGLGMEVDRFAGLPRIHHPGGDVGHQSHFSWFPGAGVGVIVLSNRGDLPPSAAGSLVRALLSDAAAAPGQDTPFPMASVEAAASGAEEGTVDFPESFLSRLVGRYELLVQPGFVLAIRLEQGELVAQATGQPSFPLSARGDTTFVIEEVGARLVFRLDDPAADEPAPSLTLYQAGQSLEASRRDDQGPPVDLASYAGRYYSDEFETFYTVVVDGDVLVVEHRRRASIRLAHVEGDLFSGPFPLVRVTFERDGDGGVTALRADAVRARDVRFQRLP